MNERKFVDADIDGIWRDRQTNEPTSVDIVFFYDDDTQEKRNLEIPR